MRISPIDLGILVLYLGGITWFGMRFRRGQQNLRDYFLGGRTAPWWALAVSIVATETSTLTIIGTPGIAFTSNLGFLQLAIGYVVARVVLCIIMVPRYFQGEFYTAYQLLENRFGAHTRSVAAAVFLATRVAAEGVRIAAIGKVVSVAFGSSERVSVCVIALLTIIYTFEGGMKAVIWTDVVQFALYMGGSIAAFFLVLHHIPNGWHGVTQAAAAAGGKFQIFDFSTSLTRSYTFWSGLLGGTFLTLASHGTDQTMVQRLLAARNEKDAKKALLASGVIVFLQFSLFLVIGVMLFVFWKLNPGVFAVNDPDKIFPEFIVTHMPVGLVGIVLAAIFAVAMSNASGSLNSLASSSMMDFKAWRGGRKQTAALSEPELLRRSRKMTLVWGLALGALGLVHWGPVLVAGLTIASITWGGLLGTFLLGFWNRRANSAGAIAGMLAGIVAMIAVNRYTPLAWTWFVLVGTTITFSVGSLVSAVTPRESHLQMGS
jgi:SSS family solute:Na+ symporter